MRAPRVCVEQERGVEDLLAETVRAEREVAIKERKVRWSKA